MKNVAKQYYDKIKNIADSDLNGLLSVYKKYNFYWRLYLNEDSKRLFLVLTDNPGNFRNIPETELEGFKVVKRVTLGIQHLFVKYVSPEHVINYIGPTLGIKLPYRTVVIKDYLNVETKKYFSIEAPIKYYLPVVQKLKKLSLLTPQLKYEMIEKYFSIRT